MTKINAMCVGGPYDGRVVVVDKHRDFFTVPVLNPMPLAPPPSTDPIMPMDAKRVTYRPQKVCNVEVWAPTVMRPHEIVQLLVMRYFCGNQIKER